MVARLFFLAVMLAMCAISLGKEPSVSDAVEDISNLQADEGWWVFKAPPPPPRTPSPTRPTPAPTPRTPAPTPSPTVPVNFASYRLIITEFDKILDIIQQETDIDNAIVATKQRLVKEAEKVVENAEAKVAHKKAKFEEAKAAYEAAEAKYQAAYAAYLKNKAVRDAEAELAAAIGLHVASLESISPPAEAEALIQTDDIVVSDVEVSHQETASTLHSLMAEVKRSSVHTSSMKTSLSALSARLVAEENKEKADVDDLAAVRDTAKAAMVAAKAEYDAALAELEQARADLAAAKEVLAAAIYTRDQNEIKRNAERNLIKQAKELLNAVLEGRIAEVTADLQVNRQNAHTNAIDDLLAKVRKQIDEEERNALARVAAALAAKQAAAKELADAKKAHEAAVEAEANAIADEARALGTMKVAEKDVAVEYATASQERAAISAMWKTLYRLSNTRVGEAGACPVTNGKICSGNGLCVDGRSRCDCHYGATGDDCATCTEGYVFRHGVCEADFSLIQVDQKDVAAVASKYGLMDLMTAVEPVNLDFVGVSDIIKKIQKELDDHMTALMTTWGNTKIAYEAAQEVTFKATQAKNEAKRVLNEKEEIFYVKDEEHKMEVTVYTQGKVIRDQNILVLGQLTSLMNQLKAP